MVDPDGAPTPRDDATDGAADEAADGAADEAADARVAGTPRDLPDETSWTDAWAEERWQELLSELEAGTRPHPGVSGADPASAIPPLAPADDAPADSSPSATGVTGVTGSGDAPGSGGAGATGGAGSAGAETGWASFDAAPWVRPAGPRDWPADDAVEALEDEESHFVPPEPPPLLGHDPLKNLAWLAVALVPVVVLVVLLAVRPFPALVGEICGGVFLAAVAVLVWRMPREREDDDPGAVV